MHPNSIRIYKLIQRIINVISLIQTTLLIQIALLIKNPIKVREILAKINLSSTKIKKALMKLWGHRKESSRESSRNLLNQHLFDKEPSRFLSLKNKKFWDGEFARISLEGQSKTKENLPGIKQGFFRKSLKEKQQRFYKESPQTPLRISGKWRRISPFPQ